MQALHDTQGCVRPALYARLLRPCIIRRAVQHFACTALHAGLYSLSTIHRALYTQGCTGPALYADAESLFYNFFPLRVDASQHTPGSAVYVGFDPTADSLHTGNLMAIMALLHFRHAGYQPIAVVRATILLLLGSLYHISSNKSA